MPIVGFGLLAVYFLRTFFVALFLTQEFNGVQELFSWQLLGDFVKVLSIVIAYQFIAKKMYLHYILTEIILVITLYLTSIYFVDMYGVKGANIAHFVTYLLYFGMILLIFSKSLFGRVSEKSQ